MMLILFIMYQMYLENRPAGRGVLSMLPGKDEGTFVGRARSGGRSTSGKGSFVMGSKSPA